RLTPLYTTWAPPGDAERTRPAPPRAKGMAGELLGCRWGAREACPEQRPHLAAVQWELQKQVSARRLWRLCRSGRYLLVGGAARRLAAARPAGEHIAKVNGGLLRARFLALIGEHLREQAPRNPLQLPSVRAGRAHEHEPVRRDGDGEIWSRHEYAV